MIDSVFNSTREHMKKAIEITRTDISTIRSGRATPALVENIVIAAYGGTQRLKLMEMATITTADVKAIVVSPYDPSQLGDIVKSIQETHSGLNPVIDGELIRISIPPLSEERRREYIKLAWTKIEGGKIMVRQGRAEGMRQLRKLLDDKSISEDQQKSGERKIQELTDEMIAELDTMGERKEGELIQI